MTDNALELAALIDRVKAATGPDRELDLEITNQFGVWIPTHPNPNDWMTVIPSAISTADRYVQRYTSSLDAVVALVERESPWADWNVASTVTDAGRKFMAEVGDGSQEWAQPTAPLALLLAYLRARTEAAAKNAE